MRDGAVAGAAQRRNPLALGHMANHPGKEDVPNVMIAAFDYNVLPGAGAALQSSSMWCLSCRLSMPGTLGPAAPVSMAFYRVHDCNNLCCCDAGSDPLPLVVSHAARCDRAAAASSKALGLFLCALWWSPGIIW